MKRIIFTLMIIVCFLMSICYVSAGPVLVSVTNVTHETYTGTGGATNATGGYVANRDLNVQSQTGAWQGYYGQITGNISLADGSGDVMYAWTGATIDGEVFASMSNSVVWTSIVAQNTCTTGELITGTGSDKVSNTFTASEGPRVNTTIADQTIVANTSCATETFVSGVQESDIWEEYILSDGTNDVWASEINDSGVAFDGNAEDYQLIVPANTTTITYYLYVELG